MIFSFNYRSILQRLFIAVIWSLDLENGVITIDKSELQKRVAIIALTSFKGIKPPKNKGENKT